MFVTICVCVLVCETHVGQGIHFLLLVIMLVRELSDHLYLHLTFAACRFVSTNDISLPGNGSKMVMHKDSVTDYHVPSVVLVHVKRCTCSTNAWCKVELLLISKTIK